MNKYDYILKMCCSSDRSRLALRTPFYQGATTYATDSCIAVCIPKRRCAGDYSNAPDNTPNCKEVLPRLEGKYSKTQIIDRDELFGKIADFNIEFEREICEDCDGEGSVECHECGVWKDCDYCDASGKKGNEEPFAQFEISDGSFSPSIKMAENHLNPNFVNKVAIAAAVLGKKKIAVTHYEECSKFELGSVKFYIMRLKK